MIKRNSFSVKLGLLLFGVIFLPVLIISLFTYRRLSASITANSQALNESNLQSIAHNIEQYFQVYQELTDRLIISSTIRGIAASSAGDRYLRLMNDRAFAQEIKSLTINDYDLEYVYLFTSAGEEYYYGYNPENLNLEPVRQACTDLLPLQSSWSSQVSFNKIFLDRGTGLQCKVLVCRPLLDYQNGRDLGLLVLQLSPEILRDLLGYTEDITFVLDGSGMILYDSVGEYCGQNVDNLTDSEGQPFFDNRNFARTGIDLRFGWQIIQLKDYRSIMSKIYTAVLPLFAVSVLCVVLFIVIAIILSRWLTAPIQTLQAAMKKVETGDITQHVEIHTNDEFQNLGNSYNHMLDQLNHFIRKAYDEELQHVNAEYRALQSQINPHFLYNSLESINSLAQIHHQPEISRMICCLADIFRYTTRQTDHLVPLRQELQHVKNYVTLQSIPYESAVQAVYQVPEDLLEFPVPKMILQPVVENCFNHAADSTISTFTILIRAQATDRGMELCVEDNGAGIPTEKLRELNAQLSTAPAHRPDSGSIGLINVCQRLRLIFQAGSGVEIQSCEGAGTTVVLKMYSIRRKEG